MQIVSVDIGSYSIKMLTFRIDKNKVIYDYAKEVVIDTDEYNIVADHIEWDLQLKIIHEFISTLNEETRLIINAPNEILSTRYLTLPLKNKKKAAQMIPFQLEEDIPFSLLEAHFGSVLHTVGQQNEALVSITKKADFSGFFDKLIEYQIEPKIITSQESVYDNFIRNTSDILPPSFCILDIGHTTTKAYFYNNKKLVSNHRSYIAGKTISEVIAENYKIDLEEATLYKHQNCFFLTKDQYETVNENQRTFANLMDKAIMPLVHEFKRWEIGHRIHEGVGISEILITGGSANIKNVHNYLATELGVKVNFLESYNELVDSKNIDSDEKFRRKFTACNVQAQSYKHKANTINLLNGEYSIQGKVDLPLQQSAFIMNRIALFCLLLVFSFFVERFFINRDIKGITQSLNSVKNNPTLDLTARYKRLIVSQTEQVRDYLVKQQRAIKQEVKLIQSASQKNALKSLNTLTSIIASYDCEITMFSAISEANFNAQIKVKNKETLDNLQTALETSGIKNIFVETLPDKLSLTVSGDDE